MWPFLRMPSLRIRRLHAAENPRVIAELTAALSTRWAERGLPSLDAAYHAAIIAGMFAAWATEREVAEYLSGIEQKERGATKPDIGFAAELLRMVLRLDEVGARPDTKT